MVGMGTQMVDVIGHAVKDGWHKFVNATKADEQYAKGVENGTLS